MKRSTINSIKTSPRNSVQGSRSAPKQIQFLNEYGDKVDINGEPLRLNYHGGAHLRGDTKVEISFDGFSLGNSHGLKSGTVTDNSQAYFLVIQTNKCNTCVNGKYMLDESIQQIGYFEFKEIVVELCSL